MKPCLTPVRNVCTCPGVRSETRSKGVPSQTPGSVRMGASAVCHDERSARWMDGRRWFSWACVVNFSRMKLHGPLSPRNFPSNGCLPPPPPRLRHFLVLGMKPCEWFRPVRAPPPMPACRAVRDPVLGGLQTTGLGRRPHRTSGAGPQLHVGRKGFLA